MLIFVQTQQIMVWANSMVCDKCLGMGLDCTNICLNFICANNRQFCVSQVWYKYLYTSLHYANNFICPVCMTNICQTMRLNTWVVFSVVSLFVLLTYTYRRDYTIRYTRMYFHSSSVPFVCLHY